MSGAPKPSLLIDRDEHGRGQLPRRYDNSHLRARRRRLVALYTTLIAAGFVVGLLWPYAVWAG